MDEEATSCKVLPHITDAYLSWKSMQDLQLQHDRWIESFYFCGERGFWVFRTVSGELEQSVYLHDTTTGEWFGNNLDEDDVFMFSEKNAIIFKKIAQSYSVHVWNVCKIEKESYETPQFPESAKPSSPKDHGAGLGWFRVDDINGLVPLDHDQPCSLLSYHGGIELPIDEDTRIFNVAIDPSYVLFTTTFASNTWMKLDLSTLEIPEDVKVFDDKKETLFIDNKWQLFFDNSQRDCHVLEFWNKNNNTSFERRMSRIPDVHGLYYYPLPPRFSYYDPVSDVLVLVYTTAIVVVPDFEKEVISEEKCLDDYVQYVNFRSSDNLADVSAACFANGRVIVALTHIYSFETAEEYNRYSLGSLLTVDLSPSDPFVIRMLAQATAPILSMCMGQDCIHCHTSTEFFSSDNAGLVKQCENFINEKLRSAHPGGIFWKSYHQKDSSPHCSPAYQHPQQGEPSTLAQLDDVVNFAKEHDKSGGQSLGILSFKISYP